MDRLYSEPQDINIRYKVEQFKKLESLLSRYFDMVELTFFLALFGYKNKQCIPLDTIDGNSEHTFSRVSYSRSSVEYDAYFGLFTILTNQDKTYDEIINRLAFLKTSNTNYKYSQLPNVQTYYGYVLGGIQPLFEICNRYNLKDSSELFDSLYEYLDELIDIVSLVELANEAQKNV
jgi:hypothetical protein